MAFPPGISSFGMQMFLQPGSSGVFARGACNVVGTMYPVYKSFKAIESEETNEDDTQWLTYWTIYGALGLVEGTTDKLLSWFPYYFHAKLAFLLWLQLPHFMGAKTLYKDYMKPTLTKYQPKLDYIIEFLQQNFGWIIEANRAQLQALYGALCTAGVSCKDFVKWFLDTNEKKDLENGKKNEDVEKKE
ncbi:hypothetical protein BSKO_11268 [Bryopsis sp. KO-2023]|nr:hypothetical protein BSKO_11268 [Bryopsis sp. KO-2023]